MTIQARIYNLKLDVILTFFVIRHAFDPLLQKLPILQFSPHNLGDLRTPRWVTTMRWYDDNDSLIGQHTFTELADLKRFLLKNKLSDIRSMLSKEYLQL